MPLNTVDPVYFAGTYLPGARQRRGQALLAAGGGVARNQAVRVGRWTSRGKEHIIVMRPMDDGLAMHQLHFKAEVRTMKDLGIEAAVSGSRDELANQLDRALAVKRIRSQRICR